MDGSEETRRALVRMHPRGDGDVIRAPSTELDELARELHRQEPEAKAAADAEATTRNAIRAILGDAAGAEGQGYRISYRQNRPSARTDWQAVAESLAPAVGSGPWADAVAAHTSAQDGPRVLRVTFGEEARSWP